MNIQIIGRKNCQNTRKAQRFFKERNIDFQFRDLAQKGLSPGELDNICRIIPPENLIDKNGKTYKKEGYQYREYNPREEIEDKPELILTPIVRCKPHVSIGYAPEEWEECLQE